MSILRSKKVKIFLTFLLLSFFAGGAFFSRTDGINLKANWGKILSKNGSELGIANGLCENCNVILVSMDTLRADHLGLYGYDRQTTPGLDRWSQDALIFTNFFTSAFMTPISEASLHTGLYPEKNGMINFRWSDISPSVKTLAEILLERGYKTAAFGDSIEFSHFKNVNRSFKRGFELYKIDDDRIGKNGTRFPEWIDIKDWINQQTRPFFLWLPLGSTHFPYSPHLNTFAKTEYLRDGLLRDFIKKEYLRSQMPLFQLIFNGDLYPKTDENFLSFNSFDVPAAAWPLPRIKQKISLSPLDFQFIRDMYDNSVVDMDKDLSGFFLFLEKLPLKRNTVVILTSNHGDQIGERGRVGHLGIYEGETHVPLIIKSPALNAGYKSDQMTSSVDFLPSLLSHLGINSPSSIDGLSFFLNGNANSLVETRDTVYLTETPLWETMLSVKGEDMLFDRLRKMDDEMQFKSYGIRTKEWKLIYRKSLMASETLSLGHLLTGKPLQLSGFELYNIKKDPFELKNVANQFPQVLQDLKQKIFLWESDLKRNSRVIKASGEFQDYF
jgi:arylsulfatase A-like enzyme